MDERDQIISRIGPDIEKDAMRAAGFILGMLAIMIGGTMLAGIAAYAIGPVGAAMGGVILGVSILAFAGRFGPND